MDPATASRERSRLIIGTTSFSGVQLNLTDTTFTNIQMIFSHEGLVRYLPSGEVGPGLASHWETDDLKKWLFHINEKAVWHDGRPVTSRDVAFTIKYTCEKNFAFGKMVYFLVANTETPDDRTLIINLKKADYNFLTQLANMPYTLPEHIFKHQADPAALTDINLINMGSGPYKLTAFDRPAGVIRLRSNDRYWAGWIPAVKEIEIRLFNNLDALILSFVNGEVDLPYVYIKGIDHFYLPRLNQADKTAVMRVKNQGMNNSLWFNSSVPPFDNVALRQAISYAIDYKELGRLFTDGNGAPPEAGFVTPNSLYHEPMRQLGHDPARAISILDDAGFRDIDGDGLRDQPDGTKLNPELVFISSSENVRCAELIRKYLHTVGIELRINAVDGGTFYSIIEANHAHQMALSSAPYWAFADYRGYFTSMVDSRYYRYANVTDPFFHDLVDRLGLTENQASRKELVKTLLQYYADNLPMIALYNQDILQPHGRKFSGWQADPLWGVLSHETFSHLRMEDQ